jgi:hypothetical protein
MAEPCIIQQDELVHIGSAAASSVMARMAHTGCMGIMGHVRNR